MILKFDKDSFQEVALLQLEADLNLKLHELHVHLVLAKVLNNCRMDESIADINDS